MPFRPVLKLCRTDEPMIGKRPIVVPGPWARVLQIRTWRGRRWKTPVPSAPPTCGVVVARGRLRAPAGNHPERVGDPVVGCWPMGEGGAGREKKKTLEPLGVRRGPAARRSRSHQWHRTRTQRAGSHIQAHCARSTTACQQQRLPKLRLWTWYSRPRNPLSRDETLLPKQRGHGRRDRTMSSSLTRQTHGFRRGRHHPTHPPPRQAGPERERCTLPARPQGSAAQGPAGGFPCSWRCAHTE